MMCQDTKYKQIIADYLVAIRNGAELHSDLKETPDRILRASKELYAKHWTKRPQLKWFDTKNPSLVVVNNLDFTSFCSHHLMPFSGSATIAYVPISSYTGQLGEDYKILGLSKFGRLVRWYAGTLQTQEDMTNSLFHYFSELGVQCFIGIRSNHSCMTARGVRHKDATMYTYRTSLNFEDERRIWDIIGPQL